MLKPGLAAVIRTARRSHRDERGQALPLLVAAMMVFVVMGVIVIDFGQMFSDRREAQRAVDLAALAAAQDLPWKTDDPDAANKFLVARVTAEDFLETNGYPAVESDVVVTVTTNYGGDARAVEVHARRPSIWRFGSLFGIGQPSVGARAVAQLRTLPTEYGIMALSHTECQAFQVEGNVTLEVIDAGILVNSNCANYAVDIVGNVIVESAQFDRYYEGGTWITSNSTVDPMPQSLGWRVDDPLSYLVEPDPATLPTSPDSGGTTASPAVRSIGGGGSLTLRPGVYWGGLSLGGGKDVTFEPGLYVMAGGGFEIRGNGDVTGDGVTIFNTTHQDSCGAIDLAGSRPLGFSPPESGPYEGLTFWQSVDCTETMVHAGTVDSLSGLIYLPTAPYELAGDGTMSGVQVIASTVRVSGNGTVTVDYENGAIAEVWTVMLVE